MWSLFICIVSPASSKWKTKNSKKKNKKKTHSGWQNERNTAILLPSKVQSQRPTGFMKCRTPAVNNTLPSHICLSCLSQRFYLFSIFDSWHYQMLIFKYETLLNIENLETGTTESNLFTERMNFFFTCRWICSFSVQYLVVRIGWENLIILTARH